MVGWGSQPGECGDKRWIIVSAGRVAASASGEILEFVDERLEQKNGQ